MLSTVPRTTHTFDKMTASPLPIILPPPRHPSSRPKLSINTEQPRILGKAASLRLETLSALSPTVRNTYSNAYEQPSTAPALQRPSRPQLSIDSHITESDGASTPSSASTLSSTLTSASTDSTSAVIPYKQPHHLTSILVNCSHQLINPCKMASSRPMFPAEKRVSFRTPLEEEIKTVKYTLAHSDLGPSSSPLPSISSNTSIASFQPASSTTHHSIKSSTSCIPMAVGASSSLQTTSRSSKPSCICPLAKTSPRTTSPQVGEKRDSSSSEDDSDSCPETPVAGRRKRTRDWRWTIGSTTGDNSP